MLLQDQCRRFFARRVPPTTSAVTPWATCRSHNRSNATASIHPSSSNGVGNAGAYPDNLETCRFQRIGRSGDPTPVCKIRRAFEAEYRTHVAGLMSSIRNRPSV